MNIPASLCIRCKGTRYLCGLNRCPIMEEFRSTFRVYSKITHKRIVSGATPPSTIVGEEGYPRTRIFFGTVSDVKGERAKEYDNPRGWWGKKELLDIVSLRSSIISGVLRVHVENPWVLYENEAGLASISEKPVSNELKLKKAPRLELKFDSVRKPVGLSSEVERIKIEENPRLHTKMEILIWDDANANVAVLEAYASNIDYYNIIRAFSLGFFGKIKRRRIVPTRWAITAVDDIVSRNLIKKINNYNEISHPLVFVENYLYNNFIIILLPGSYESYWIEVWYPKSLWTKYTDIPQVFSSHENQYGEIKPEDGGFSAARLPVVEYLFKNKRRAKAIIYREILPEYIVPLGNWHIRETVRHALQKEGYRPYDTNDMLEYIRKKAHYPYAIHLITNVLKKIQSQTKIDMYITK